MKLLFVLIFAALAASAARDNTGEAVKSVAAHDLPSLPGKRLTAVMVTYAPGAKSARHHHSGSVWVYVLSGAIRSQNSATGLAKVYRASESFFEPPGSEHVVSENASAIEPASLLAVHIADRLELSPGGACTHWKSAAFSRRTPTAVTSRAINSSS